MGTLKPMALSASLARRPCGCTVATVEPAIATPDVNVLGNFSPSSRKGPTWYCPTGLGVAWTCSPAAVASGETEYAGISPSLQAIRGFTPAASKALPLPTSMKSFWQALIVWAATSKSLASYLWSTSLRPLMPPAALHQVVKACATSKNSRSRPGAATAPGSAMVPTWISVELTPRTPPPRGFPGPQIPFRSPKSPLATLAALELPGGAVGPFVGTELDRPQAPAVTATRTVTAEIVVRARRVVRGPVMSAWSLR